MEERRHWSQDSYWVEAAEQFERLRQTGETHITLSLPAILEVAYRGDGPAYKLMAAMVSVQEQEGMDGFKGAPRLMLALLARLHELSNSEEHNKEAEQLAA